jgi:hypothetical protein
MEKKDWWNTLPLQQPQLKHFNTLAVVVLNGKTAKRFGTTPQDLQL